MLLDRYCRSTYGTEALDHTPTNSPDLPIINNSFITESILSSTERLYE